MPTFKDTNGREWNVRANVGIIKEVRENLQVNLAALDGKIFERLQDDPELLVNVLWIVCKEDAAKASITPEKFGEALVGDVIDDATQALTQAIANFFPKRKRELMTLLATKTETLRELQFQKVKARMNDPKNEQRITEALDKAMNQDFENALTQLTSATSSPGSSESSPTP